MTNRPSHAFGLVLLLGTWLLATHIAHGAVVYLKGEEQPIAGYLESSDDKQIVLRVPVPGGEAVHRTIERAQIDLLLQPVNPARLEELSPDNPTAYREYAEELVEKTADPDAVETATRLFLIAAHLDPQHQARSALLGMTPLMEHAQGVRQLRALAYLLGPDHDVSLLAGNSKQALPGGTPLDDTQREQVIEVLHFLRQGKRSDAKQRLQQEELRAWMRQGTNKITPQECLSLAEGNCPGCTQGTIPSYMLQKLVAAEYELSSSDATREVGTQWGYYLNQEFQRPLPVLSLLKATSIDPRQCVYRDGEWVEP
ncbi:hypothetical protein [Blastopirellula marina]|uniref:Uncharacterized protein n=1 Tax=Blastopirellula marina TaxID=124 RepID=A0A2S8GP84_9BACT|nr:hypothetical protein [Blastopirellula marina]PQO46161.1 hypothetical protein C5Y93_09225 [Blastopirellula marina]